ncbi:MAG: 2Fe-2S iron-sulfur cluster-binding protein [Anaerolineales bacterium]
MLHTEQKGTQSRLLRTNFDRPLTFTFDGKAFTGFEGDTLASAMYRAGVRVFSRSFKYHRPRGLMTIDGTSPNDLVEIDRVPNLHASTTRLKAGMQVRSQNAWPSVRFDLMSILNGLGALLPVGFYYKTMIRPKLLWPFYEKLLRRAAGLGSIAPDSNQLHEDSFEKSFIQADISVIGGGPSGMIAALAAAHQGARVVLVEKEPILGGHLAISEQTTPVLEKDHFLGIDVADYPTTTDLVQYLSGLIRENSHIQVLTSATAFGWYEENEIGVQQEDRLVKLRTKQLIVATGRFEQPIIFQNNDLPGVILAGGVQRLINLYGIKPGDRAVVITLNDQGWTAARDLLNCGVDIAMLADARPAIPENSITRHIREAGVPVGTGMTIKQALGRSSVRGAVLTSLEGTDQSMTLNCDLIVISGGYSANNALLYQGGGRITYDPDIDDFIQVSTPPNVQGAGHAIGTRTLEAILLEGTAAGLEAAKRLGYFDGQDTLPEINRQVKLLKETNRLTLPALSNKHNSLEGNKAFVCFCEDVVPKDVLNAAGEGFDDIQTLKRYTTISMGPSQGKLCSKNTIKMLAGIKQQDVAQTGTTTSRPPFVPVKLGVLAGRKLA